MKGLSQAMGPEQQAGPKQKPASKEEQAEYNKFVGMGMTMLWSDQFMPTAEKMLKASPDEVEAMARLGVAIGSRIYDGAKKQGHDISPAVMLHGGLEIMQQITEFAIAAGIPKIGPEDTEDAYYLAADMFRAHLQGKGEIDPEASAADLDQITSSYGAEPVENAKGRIQNVQQRQMQAMVGGQQPQEEQQQ